MDILAHMLWANYGARAGNKVLEKKKKPLIKLAWVTFWGVFPDLFAFTIPFCIAIFSVVFDGQSFVALRNHHGLAGGFDIASTLYQYSHSIVIWAVVFCVVWIISKRPRFELLAGHYISSSIYHHMQAISTRLHFYSRYLTIDSSMEYLGQI
jgi:uncharacterized membrane protein